MEEEEDGNRWQFTHSRGRGKGQERSEGKEGGLSCFTETSGEEILPCSVWGRGPEPGATVSRRQAPKMNGETSETFFSTALSSIMHTV